MCDDYKEEKKKNGEREPFTWVLNVINKNVKAIIFGRPTYNYRKIMFANVLYFEPSLVY